MRNIIDSERINPDELYKQRACMTCLHSAICKENGEYFIVCMFSPANMQFVSPRLFCSQYSEGGELMKTQREQMEGRIQNALLSHGDVRRDLEETL